MWFLLFDWYLLRGVVHKCGFALVVNMGSLWD